MGSMKINFDMSEITVTCCCGKISTFNANGIERFINMLNETDYKIVRKRWWKFWG